MRHRRRVGIILSLLVFALIFQKAGVEAAAAKQSVSVSYTYSGDKLYPLKLTVRGNGTLIDGTKEIREGTVEYNLLPGTRKTFEIRPDPGYEIESLSYKNPLTNESISLMDRLTDNMFYLDMEGTEMILEVTFKKIGTQPDTGENGGDETGGNGTGSPGGTGSKPSGGTGKDSADKSQDSTVSEASGAKTGDYSRAEWYLLMMLFAVAASAVFTARKRKVVYKKSE